MGVVTIIGGVVWVGFSFVAKVPEAVPDKLEPMGFNLACQSAKPLNFPAIQYKFANPIIIQK